jgi:hypothetical protein
MHASARENRLPILARILRDRGIVTEKQLQEAIQHQVLYGGRLGTSLYELGFITEGRLQEALSRAHGVPAVAIDLREIQPEAVALLPKALASRHKVFPYKVRGKTLFLLMVDPTDHEAVAKVGFSLGYIVKPLVVPEFRMIQLLKEYYGVDERWRYNDTHRTAPPAPQPLDQAAAAARIDAASTRDEVVEALLGAAHRYFRRVIFFIVREPWVLGWSGIGEGMDRSLATSLRIPLDRPSVFQTVARDKTVFVGRLGAEPETQAFMKAIAKRASSNAVVMPIAVKGRIVNLLYGDSGAAGNVRTSLGELMVLFQKVPRAYLRIIRRRIDEARKATAAAEASGRETQ